MISIRYKKLITVLALLAAAVVAVAGGIALKYHISDKNRGALMGDSLSIGMNIHNRRYMSYPAEDLEKNIDACEELGMNIVRFNQSGIGEEDLEEITKVSDLCHARGIELMLCVDKNFYSDDKETLEERENRMYENFKILSGALKDKVDYYQVFNEMDVACMNGKIVNIFLKGKDGKEKGEYDYVRWERAIASVKGALRGMKEGYPEGKTCINFGWWHTALIYELYNIGCRWDITGLDWYSDCEEVSSVEKLMEDVGKHIPDCDFMICETNYWMNLHDRYTPEHKEALKKAESRDKWQSEWVPEFIDTLIGIKNPRLKAVIFYELMDEPCFEEDRGKYTGESHFGFIACDKHGKNRQPKPAFYSLKEKVREINP